MAGEPRAASDALRSQERAGEERDRLGLSQALRRVEVAKRLAEAPYRFGFFQALRRLECLHRERPRIGEAVRLRDEYLRLGQDPSLAFAPSTLSSWEPARRALALRGWASTSSACSDPTVRFRCT